MPGFVYLATVANIPNFVKIGISDNDVDGRMQQLTAETGSFGVHKSAYSRRVENHAAVEKELHEKFYFCRLRGKEYFLIDWRAVKLILETVPEMRLAASVINTPPPTPATENGENDAFINALQNCDLSVIQTMIDNGMDMNLDTNYGWTNLNRATHGNLYIGKLLAQNPDDLMGHRGRPIIKALMVAYIRHNPGIGNTPIFRRLGIRTMAINGDNNDWFAWKILKSLESQQQIENRGRAGNPQWYVAD